MFNPAEALRDNPALFACYILYVYFRGQNAVRIEREMRALGYTTFHRRSLYPRGKHPGWIAKYWSADTPVRMSVASTRKVSADILNRSIDPDNLAGGTGDADKGVRTPPDFHSWLKLVAPNMTWHWKHQQGDHRSAREIHGGQATAADDLPPAASRKDGPYPCMRCSFKSIYQRVASYNLRIANCEGLPLILWRPVKTGQAAHPKTP